MLQVNYIRASMDGLRFDKYLEKTVAKLKELGCNLEIMDKMASDLNHIAWDSFDNISYVIISRILAKKVISAKIV